jgi:hypothetical protein
LTEYVEVAGHAIESIAAEGFGEVGEDHLLDVIGERVEGGACAGHCGRLCSKALSEIGSASLQVQECWLWEMKREEAICAVGLGSSYDGSAGHLKLGHVPFALFHFTSPTEMGLLSGIETRCCNYGECPL